MPQSAPGTPESKKSSDRGTIGEQSVTPATGDYAINIGGPRGIEIVQPSASLPRYPIPTWATVVTVVPALKPTPSVKETLGEIASRLKAMISQRDKLDAEIQDALTTLQGLQKMYGVTPDEPTPFGPKTFRGMSALDAISAYLDLVKDTATVAEIAKSLLAGGFETKSADFSNSVYMALRRDAESDDPVVRKYGKKWGLKRWENERGTKFAP